MEAKYITITPTTHEDSDFYYTATIALFNNEKELEESEPFDAWLIDSFSVMGNVRMDFEFTKEGRGIRLWGMDGNYLSIDKSYGPTICLDPLC